MTELAPDNPNLIDRAALIAHRARVKPEALFLHDVARAEVQDRLELVNRTFTDVAIVTPFTAPWLDAFPDATLTKDNDVLNLQPSGYDLIIHAMGLHWANDPVGQLIQCRRALRPDGLLLTLCLGGETLHELRASLQQAEIDVAGGLSPRMLPMADLRALGGLLHRAGFTLPVADSVPLTAEYRDLYHLMTDLRNMGETNALSDRLKRPTRRAVFELAESLYRARHPASGDRLRATFELICLTGWTPHDSQPRPLRPGSARTRLADALGAQETKLPD